jgi:hypothetical protein
MKNNKLITTWVNIGQQYLNQLNFILIFYNIFGLPNMQENIEKALLSYAVHGTPTSFNTFRDYNDNASHSDTKIIVCSIF